LGKLHNQIRIVSISHLMHFVIINVISIHYWWIKHSLCTLGDHFGAKTADYLRKSVKLLPVNISLINSNPCLSQRVISRVRYSESL
jgi:hypothetical protein